MSVPTASDTVTAPVVFSVRFDTAPAAVPDTASRLTVLLPPAPTVSVTPSASVTSPRSTDPLLPEDTVASAVTATPVFASPSVTSELFDVERTVPAIDTALASVTETPPVKVVESEAPLPKVTVPEFRKEVDPAIEFVPPVIDTLNPPDAETVMAPDTVRSPWNATVCPLSVSETWSVDTSTEDWNVAPALLTR